MRPIGTTAVLAWALTAITAHAGPSPVSPAQQAELACITMNTQRLPLETRRSPLDSVTFQIDGRPVKVCYSRPSANGREIFGGLIAYNRLWRTGANEPTMIHTSIALDIAGIRADPGSYSLYTVPGESEWQVIVNRSISQWGHEGQYRGEVQAQEVGRATVTAAEAADYVETLTIAVEQVSGGNATLALEWERTRVEIPISAAK